MTDEEKDIPEMVAISSAVVLNIGTLNERIVRSMLLAGKIANEHKIPVILDPVGVGATTYRTKVIWNIIDSVKIDVIKGNSGEIAAMCGDCGTVKGVDSVSDTEDARQTISLSERTGAIVAATGRKDYVSDGKTTYILENGCNMMGTVSGTGCMASSVVGAYVGAMGASAENVAAAISAFNIAGEIASMQSKGPGSFKIMLMDSMYNLETDEVRRRLKVSKNGTCEGVSHNVRAYT